MRVVRLSSRFHPGVPIHGRVECVKLGCAVLLGGLGLRAAAHGVVAATYVSDPFTNAPLRWYNTHHASVIVLRLGPSSAAPERHLGYRRLPVPSRFRAAKQLFCPLWRVCAVVFRLGAELGFHPGFPLVTPGVFVGNTIVDVEAVFGTETGMIWNASFVCWAFLRADVRAPSSFRPLCSPSSSLPAYLRAAMRPLPCAGLQERALSSEGRVCCGPVRCL